MPDIKFTFTGEERGLIADALRAAGALDSAKKAADKGTEALTKQEAAIAKLAHRLRELARQQTEAENRLSKARGKGADPAAIDRMTAALDRLKQKSAGVQEALTFDKLDASVKNVGDHAGHAEVRFSSMFASLTAGISVMGMVHKGFQLTNEALEKGAALAKDYNAGLAGGLGVRSAAAGGSQEVLGLRDAIRAQSGLSMEESTAAASAAIGAGLGQKEAVGLAASLAGKVENPGGLINLGGRIKTAGLSGSVSQAINMALGAFSAPGVIVKDPAQLMEGFLDVGVQGKGLGASMDETAAMLNQAVHLKKNPEKAMSTLHDLGEVFARFGIQGQGWAGKMDTLAGWGVFKDPNSPGGKMALRSIFGTDELAQSFLQLRAMSDQRGESQKAIQSAMGIGGASMIERLAGTETATSRQQRAAERAQAQSELAMAGGRDSQLGIAKQKMLADLESAALGQGMGSTQRAWMGFKASKTFDLLSADMLGLKPETVARAAVWTAAGQNGAGLNLQGAYDQAAARSSTQPGPPADPAHAAAIRENTEATKTLTAALKDLYSKGTALSRGGSPRPRYLTAQPGSSE